MTELTEETSKELDDICDALIKSKGSIEKKFKSILEEFMIDAWNEFDNQIECSNRYDFERWVAQTANKIVEGLLAGETKWLKQQAIISEYSWDQLQKIRLAIWNAANEGITESLVYTQQKEIEELKKDINFYRNMR